MANFIVEGVKAAGGTVSLVPANEFSKDMLDNFDAIAFGCPSMGAEELEESEFEPMFSSVKHLLSGRHIALFGSYGWGDGEWMRTWEQECNDYGAKMVSQSVICNEAPDDEGAAACRALGKALAQ
jgi:flavodoxin short chain